MGGVVEIEFCFVFGLEKNLVFYFFYIEGKNR